jgi:hypothetical protein
MLEVAGEALKISRAVPWDTLCRPRPMKIQLQSGPPPRGISSSGPA